MELSPPKQPLDRISSANGMIFGKEAAMTWNPSYRIRVVCSGLALSLAACGGGSSGGSANPASLAFSQAKGAPAPAAQMLDISDSEGGSHAWNAEAVYQSGSGWLRIAGATSASGATLPASLAIAVSPSAAPGTWNATVRVTGNGRSFDVPVSYTVSPEEK